MQNNKFLNKNYLNRDQMLELPVSIQSYIILRDYVLHHGDAAIYKKLLGEYLTEIPVFELVQILSVGRIMLRSEAYQEVVEMIFVH